VSDQDNKPWEWGDKGVPHNPINHYPEGTRFLCCGYDGHMNQFSQGNYVRYEDYARLKAEVERLTKAGDAMEKQLSDWLEYYGYDEPKKDISIEAWNAAKEGQP
jgi:hypothetical protein